jgi:hypothetical protein
VLSSSGYAIVGRGRALTPLKLVGWSMTSKAAWAVSMGQGDSVIWPDMEAEVISPMGIMFLEETMTVL